MPRTGPGADAPSRPNDPSLLIMTSLLGGAKHGYALLQDIEASAGVRLGPGTLYGAISRLEQRGAIEALPVSGRTRPYRLSETGASELEAALGELRTIVQEGTERLARRRESRGSAIGGLA
jgi:DNA-binding PadR family transcriptional regulator